ncbi:hypothetical protein [Altererythrobacter sp. Root672]|uniref:hypothetical protein n=1 Tax=Altererythrobacter sp. Root672 TaxID=1736584 RepID=UPI0012E37135|nr:hypothetical protein [Altererythrobacter sp. Root672]
MSRKADRLLNGSRQRVRNGWKAIIRVLRSFDITQALPGDDNRPFDRELRRQSVNVTRKEEAMFRRRLVLLAGLLFPTVTLVACADETPTYRYRMTVEVDMPEGLKSGSSVIEVDTSIVRPGSNPAGIVRTDAPARIWGAVSLQLVTGYDPGTSAFDPNTDPKRTGIAPSVGRVQLL